MLSQSFETIKVCPKEQKIEINEYEDNQLKCNICLLLQNVQNCYSMGCGHLFCKNCLISHINQQISNYQLITCCQQQCKHTIDYSQKSIYHVLELKTKKIVDSILSNYNRISMLHHCSSCKRGVLTQSIFQQKAVLTCNECGTHFCYNCFKPYHKPNIACVSKQKIELPPDCQQCQKCQSIIQKQQGCPHIKCLCGYQFCFECGFHWDQTHICEHKIPKRTGISKVCCNLTKILFSIPLLVFVGLFFLIAIIAICFVSSMLSGVVFWQFVAKKYLIKSQNNKVAQPARTEQSLEAAAEEGQQVQSNNCCTFILFCLWILMLPVIFVLAGVVGFMLPLINVCYKREYVLKPDILKQIYAEIQGWIYLYTIM